MTLSIDNNPPSENMFGQTLRRTRFNFANKGDCSEIALGEWEGLVIHLAPLLFHLKGNGFKGNCDLYCFTYVTMVECRLGKRCRVPQSQSLTYM